MVGKFEQTVSAVSPSLQDRIRRASKKFGDTGEASKSLSVSGPPEATPRWRGLGFNGILAAAIRAEAPPEVPKNKGHASVQPGSSNVGPRVTQVLESDPEVDEQKEELLRLQRKRDMLRKKLNGAEEKCRATTKENETLQSRVSTLQKEAQNAGGERFFTEERANETSQRLQEVRVACEALRQQEMLDRRVFTDTLNLKERALHKLTQRPGSGSSTRSGTKQKALRPGSKDKKIGNAEGGGRLTRPASSPVIINPDSVPEPVDHTSAPSRDMTTRHVEALLIESRRASERVRSAAAFHRASCPLQAAVASADATRSQLHQDKVMLEMSIKQKAGSTVQMQKEIARFKMEMEQINADREERSEDIAVLHETVFGLEKDCEKQEAICAQTAIALEVQKERAICDAEAMRQPIEDAENEVAQMKEQLQQSKKESSRCCLEARHHNEWRMWSAASFRRQKEDTEGRQRRLRSANASVGRQIDRIQKERAVYTSHSFDFTFGRSS